MKFSMEKEIKKFWIAGFFLPAINATVFKNRKVANGEEIFCHSYLPKHHQVSNIFTLKVLQAKVSALTGADFAPF